LDPDPADVQRYRILFTTMTLLTVSLGVGLNLLGFDGPGWGSTIRLAGSSVGAIGWGAIISLNPRLALSWWLAGLAGLLLGFLAVPPHWDSLQLVLKVFGVVSLVAGGLAALPQASRYTLILGIVAFHFSSILCATTWPEPTPWLTMQLGQRVYLPWMQFTYLRNAYHFYSPDPGPASLLFVLLDTEETDPSTGKTTKNSSWVISPHRATNMRDPLGVSYYRRLSLTESAARVGSDLSLLTEDKKQAVARREAVALGTLPGHKMIPYAPENFEPKYRQQLTPTADVIRYLLPSYARHLSWYYSNDQVKVTKIRLYRAEHKIVTTPFFVTQSMSPFYPTLFRVYFLGDYSPEGQLIDPQDPMLYWVIPILPKGGKRSLKEFTPDDIDDYLSKHAGFEFDWRSLRP
jgi:hypothetical protein